MLTKKMDVEKTMLCPRCGIAMKKVKKKEIIIDICGRCGGMWLDRHEMEKLLKSGGM